MSGFAKIRSATATFIIILLTLIWRPETALAAPPLSTYGQLPGFEMAAISQSGNRIALIGRVGEKRHLVITGEDNKPIQNSSLGDMKVRGLY